MSFDHREPGTPESAWATDPRWADLPRWAGDVDHLVVLAAHPDDETLGAGGLIRLAARAGARVSVVVATDGEGSHPDSPTTAPEELAARRRAELPVALGELGASTADIAFLGLPDGQVLQHRELIAARLRDVIAAAAAESHGGHGARIVLVAPWAGDGHRDHRVSGELARQVARECGVPLLEYPIWLWHWAQPASPEVPWADLVLVDLDRDALDDKRRAVACHASQVLALSDEPGDEAVLHAGMQAHVLRDVEAFVVVGAASASLAPEFFDDFYRDRRDPWGFESRWYEERKRAVLLAALPHPRYGSTLEIGCATGVLTAMLATRSDHVLAVDVSADPLERAGERLRGVPGVELRRMRMPQEWPAESFDLIVVSEVAYYWSESDRDAAVAACVASLAEDGVIVACHWRHPVAEYPASGDAAHRSFSRRPDLIETVRHVEEDFVLGVFQRPPGESVARQSGIIA